MTLGGDLRSRLSSGRQRKSAAGEISWRARAKNGPRYLRWALVEAAIHAARDDRYKDRYERTKKRLGRQIYPRISILR